MSSNEKIALLRSYNIRPGCAQSNVTYGLQYFDLADLKRILDRLSPLPDTKGSRELCGPAFYRHDGWPLWMLTLDLAGMSLGILTLLPFQILASSWLLLIRRPRAIRTEIPRPTIRLMDICLDLCTYIKAPIHLVKESILRKAALCVNRAGRFSVRQQRYTVMSHVWSETMGWHTSRGFGPLDLSLRKQGISRRHFLKFFDRCEAEWLWVDVIAMPEVLEDMDSLAKEETEKLRMGVINSLRNIYGNADKLVVIDTALLRLSSPSLVDAAVCLCLSLWMTRLWTLTEVRLAPKVFLKTRDRFFDLDEIIGHFGRDVLNDQSRYWFILQRLAPLRDVKYSGFPPSAIMQDFAFCNRQTDVREDKARALFPLFKLDWQHGWTCERGLAAIMDACPAEENHMRRYCEVAQIQFDSLRALE